MAHKPSYQQGFNSLREEDQTRGAGGDGREVFGSGAWNALGSIYNYQQQQQQQQPPPPQQQQAALTTWDQDQNQNQHQETTKNSKVSTFTSKCH